jgi:hypothetical protein
MKWTLFARLERTVARARRLDPDTDRPALAQILNRHNPKLGAATDDAALSMAGAALTFLCRLPMDIDEAAASIIDANPLAPTEALARVASLAYVALCDDLLPDDLPGGSGLVDDAISLRATGVGAPNGWDQDERARQLEALGVEARFLSLFLPRDRMDEFNRALGELFWTIAAYTRAPLSELKDVTRRLIEEPPKSLSELLLLHEGAAQIDRPKLFWLCDAALERDGETLRFVFDDGVVIELVDGHLRLIARA